MELVKRESCQEYFRRRLSEGWKCISLEGHNAVLLSPWGQRRELDLRNDVETLRPSAAGGEESIEDEVGNGTGDHHELVDEVEADDDTTFVRTYSDSYLRDLYNLPASSGEGIINFIKVYFRCYATGGLGDDKARASIKSNSTVTDGDEEVVSTVEYTDYSMQWNTNPADSEPWTWADIDALQIGVSIKAAGDSETRCTQVYVEVDYEPVVGPFPTHFNIP